MSEFRSQLENAVSARHSRLNPFTERWVGGELTRQQLGAWVCQHYQYVSQFPRWCAAVYAECPDADARDFLLENIVEEESGIKHVDLLIRFGEACGVSRQEVETARQLPTTRALTAWCFETSPRAGQRSCRPRARASSSCASATTSTPSATSAPTGVGR